jgi:hypothetical protein
VDPIVKDAVFFHPAHPGKVGFSEMLLHFLYLYLGMIRPEAADMNLNNMEEEIVLRI